MQCIHWLYKLERSYEKYHIYHNISIAIKLICNKMHNTQNYTTAAEWQNNVN